MNKIVLVALLATCFIGAMEQQCAKPCAKKRKDGPASYVTGKGRSEKSNILEPLEWETPVNFQKPSTYEPVQTLMQSAMQEFEEYKKTHNIQ